MTDKDRVDISLEEFLKMRDEITSLKTQNDELNKEIKKESNFVYKLASRLKNLGLSENEVEEILTTYKMEVTIQQSSNIDTLSKPVVIALKRM